jgi:hypothetical protein
MTTYRRGCREALPIAIAVFTAGLAVICPPFAEAQAPKANRNSKTELQGLWQMTSYDTGNGLLEEKDPPLFRTLMMFIWIRGSHSYWIHGAIYSSFVTTRTITCPAESINPFQMDFQDTDNNDLLATLCELKGQTLTICHSDFGVNKDRPKLLLAKENDVVLFKFNQMITPASNQGAPNHHSQFIGLWETYAIEKNGEALTKRDRMERTRYLLFQDRECFIIRRHEQGLVVERAIHAIAKDGADWAVDIKSKTGVKTNMRADFIEGNLVICFRADGQRPGSIGTGVGDGRTLERFRKVDTEEPTIGSKSRPASK